MTAICTACCITSPLYAKGLNLHLHSTSGEMATKARKYVLRSHFSGLPKREDLEIVEGTLPPLKDGGTATMNCRFITQGG